MAQSSDAVKNHAGQTYSGPREQPYEVRKERSLKIYRPSRQLGSSRPSFSGFSEGKISSDHAAAMSIEFTRNGYVVLRNFLDPDRARLAKSEVDRIAATLDPTTVSFEPGFTPNDSVPVTEKLKHIRKLRRFVINDLSRELSAIARDALLLQAVSACLSHTQPKKAEEAGSGSTQKEPVLSQDIALIKKPGGIEKPPHQDSAYFLLRPGMVCGAWIALEPADKENGCMHVIPRSHKLGPRPHYCDLDCMLHDDEWLAAAASSSAEESKEKEGKEGGEEGKEGLGKEGGEEGKEGLGKEGGEEGKEGLGKEGGEAADSPPLEGIVEVKLDPGDVLLFSDLIFHATPPNDSDRGRTALQFHYRAPWAEEISLEEHGKIFHDERGTASCITTRPMSDRPALSNVDGITASGVGAAGAAEGGCGSENAPT